MSNLQAKMFEEALRNLINGSGLKVSEAYYIVKNASLELQMAYEQVLQNEQEQERKTASLATNEEETENGQQTDTAGHSASANDDQH